MLEQLFGSRARVKILKIFLLNPREKYYIRQLARKLKLQLNSVRRELENLESFGILISSPAEEGRTEDKKYFQANPNFVLYEEVKALIVKAQILYGQDFIGKLQKQGKIKLLIFTGIFVNNDDSPIDLLIVGRFNKIKLVRLIKELEDDLSKEVNFTLMESREFRYRRELTDVFLYKILEGKKIVVIDEIGLS